MRVIVFVNSIVSVQNFELAARGLATTTFRALIGDIILDDVLSKREDINRELQVKLDKVIDQNTITLQYLETFKAIAGSGSTKTVVKRG